MALTPGTRLGTYDIIGPLGEGGMGEVYRARDTKLNRDVAIKVLPDRLANDPAALARFEREAQAVAALSHPNILAIYDFGTDRGIAYAVTELLEGETLRVRLANGALPPRKAIDLGVHIVRGIAAAHERGIVHRDLKPENVFVTKDGVVKILDFGLAKSPLNPGSKDPGLQGAGAPGNDETRVFADTTPGTVLGTVGYMSPEQVRGMALDHRTDIFSFGAMLYEMLTGRRAFRGDSHVETMNAILKEDPQEFAEINPNLPGSLDRIVRRCVEKLPADRFHSAHDLAISLEALSGASTQSTSSMAAATAAIAPPRRRVSPLLAAAAVVVVGAAAFFAGRGVPGGGSSLTDTEFIRLTYRRGPIRSSAIAPDGATFVYSAAWEGSPLQVYSTRSDSPESQALPYTPADVVSISSKGELAIIRSRRPVAFFARVGTLARATLTGGASRDVLEGVQHADWLPDGSDLVVSRTVDAKYQIEFPIGKVVYQTTGWVSHLAVSPDGRLVAFQDQPILGDDRGGISIVDAAGNRQALAVECESTQGIAWAPSGKEVWFTCASKGLWRALLAVTLDGKVRKVLQVPGSLFLGDIGPDGTVLLSHDNARTGVIGLAPGEAKERDLSWLDWTQPAMLSDDGKTLLFREQGEGGGPGYAVFLRGTDGSPAVRLGTGEAIALSPDGKSVIAQDVSKDPAQLILLPTGAGQARPLTNDDIAHVNGRFLPDGKRFVFSGFKPDRPNRMWIQSIDGGAAVPVTEEGVTGLILTPDGKRLVVRGADGVRRLQPIDPPGGAAEEIKHLEPQDIALRFTADDRFLLVRRNQPGGVAQVVRLDVTSGARTVVRTISPLSPEIGVGPLQVSADGSAFIYGYSVTHSDLFLVKGLK